MIKYSGSVTKNKQSGIRPSKIEIVPLHQSSIEGGMVSVFDPPNIQNNQLIIQKNYKTFFDYIIKRFGATLFVPLKPDSNPILGLVAFAANDGTVKLVRLTPSSIYSGSASAWTAVTGGGLAGGADDRFNAINLGDDLYLSNNGANVIQKVDLTLNTYADLGNAPEYSYITAFGDRIVGANLQGGSPNPIQVGWSGNLNYPEWSPLVDNTAGNSPLTDSDSDLSDFITSISGFDDVMVITRERSIWEATKTGNPTQPFYFRDRIPGVGCDSHYSVARGPGMVIFTDTATKDVYIYTIDGNIIPIAKPIRTDLFSSIVDPDKIFGAYNKATKEYTICTPTPTSAIVRAWTYSLETKGWWFDEYINLSCISDIDYNSGAISIDDLLGTIDQLLGTIDSLSPSTSSVTRLLGYTTGELAIADPTSDTDWNGVITSEIFSKEFRIPSLDIMVSVIEFEYTPESAGSFLVEYSIDGGNNFTIARLETFSSSDIGNNTLYSYRKQIRARRFMWKISSSSGLVSIYNYTISVSQSGDSRK